MGSSVWGRRRRRVVVTGFGCVTPLGGDAESTWRAALEGRSGIRTLPELGDAGLPVHMGGPVDGTPDLGDIPPREARRLDPVIAYAVAAAREASARAGLVPEVFDRDRAGVAIGTAIGGIRTLYAGLATIRERPSRLSPFAIPMTIGNMVSGYVAIQQGLRGPNLCHVSACATGAHSIGEAARIIERGQADVMLAGGSEAACNSAAIAGFAAMRALSTRNDSPAAASRPFESERDGFVMSEGAAVLVLEELEHARARGAAPCGEILGYGLCADAAHMALPAPGGEGAQRCMRLTLEDAGLSPADVDYLNAHATSTPAGDLAEVQAVRAVFGAHADALAVSATKSMTGHLLGAAGALEAIFCLQALANGVIPPTINLDRPDPECALDHVAHKPRYGPLRAALSNSFGFGGTNAALLFGRA